MKSFFKEFLRDTPTPGGSRQIFLGAFGKHPGWNDHMDDIGLETESLVAAKTRLYVDGIGSQISSGAWGKLGDGQQVPFHHTFVWSRPPQLLIGKLWASRDGKGRALYPMIACAHTIGISLELALQGVLPCIEHIRATAVAARTAREITDITEHYRDSLRDWIRDAVELQPAVDVPKFLSQIDFATADDGLCKVLAEVRASQYRARAGQPSDHFRFPAASESPELTIQFWEHFLASQIVAGAPIFLALPANQYWMDSIIGEPAPADFFCLRTSSKVTPLSNNSDGATSEITPSLSADAKSLLESLAAGTPRGEAKSWISRLFH